MIPFILAILTFGALIFGTISYIKTKDFIAFIMCTVIAWLPLCLLYLLISVILSDFIDRPYEKIEQMEIISIRDQNDLNGSFILGCGSLSMNNKYVAYIKTPDGGIKQWKCDVNSATIYYTDEDPKVEKYKQIDSWLIAPKKERWKIYIPKGSI
ncbi:MAG: hypothetical protein GF364_04905, partial [Candidatus Lokiarchaeota archaeon]|nr:hypothetical protein [Candidatus Lokiarchaeota archaeon]